MEAYVTRKEFDKALKELRHLKSFLVDTFGNKFLDFGKPQKEKEGGNYNGQNVHVVQTQDRTLSSRRDVREVYAPINKQSLSSLEDPTPIEVLKDPLKHEMVELLDEEEEDFSIPLNITSGTGKNPNTKQNEKAQASTKRPGPSHTRAPPSISEPAVDDNMNGSTVNPRTFRITVVTSKPTSSNNEPPTSSSLDKTKTNHSDPVKSSHVSTPQVPTQSFTVNSSTVIAAPSPRIFLPSFKKRSLKLDGAEQNSASSRPAKKVTTRDSHLTSSNSSATEIIQCDQCQLFVYSSQLDEHVKNHAILGDKGITGWQNNPLFKERSTCPLCKITCSDFVEYEKHCLENHKDGMPCPVCGKCFQLFTRLKRHMFAHKNQKFTCDICGKSYNRKDNLTAHIKSHDDSEPTLFYCGVCKNAAFSSREGRDRHMNSLHQNAMQNEFPSTTDKQLLCPTETITCGSGTASLLSFEYEGDDDADMDGMS